MNDYSNVKVQTPDTLAKRDEPNDNITTVKDMLKSKEKQIYALLGKQLDPVKFAIVAMTTIRANEKLQQCSANSLVTSIIMAAQRGLSLDPTLGHAYLVPYWNSDLRCFEAQYQTGYKGKIFMAQRDSGIILDTFVIYEKDRFKISRTENGDTFIHEPCPLTEEPGEAIGWMGRARLPDGKVIFEVMRRSEIEKIRQTVKTRYKGKDTPAWAYWYDEQARGKVVNRIAKYLPQAASLQEDAATEDALDAGAATIIDIKTDDGETLPVAVQVDALPEKTETKPEKKQEVAKQDPAKPEEPIEEESQGGFDPCDELILVAKDKWCKTWKDELEKLCKKNKINSSKMTDQQASMMLDILNNNKK